VIRESGNLELWKSMKDQISRIKIDPAAFLLDHPSNILTLGSCFSDSIGNRLKRLKFAVSSNPFGTLFNPISIARNVRDAINLSHSEEHLVFHDGLWKSLDLHSDFCHPSKEKLLLQLQRTQEDLIDRLKTVQVVFITLGSAVVFRYTKSGEIIANNHKLPSKEFQQELLGIEEIQHALTSLFEKLRGINSKIHIVLSLSPVRHLAKGAILNQRSKARLLEGIHSVLGDRIHYFPAYELILDELRDYRYYKDDLVHPSDQAVDRVWDGLMDYCFSSTSKELIFEIEQVLKMQEHRTQHPKAPSSIQFQEVRQQKIEGLIQRFPHLNFD